MLDPLSVEITADGSQTLFSEQFQAHYHSQHGALQESRHVFIQEGIDYYRKLHQSTDVSILEYGMGTALNVLLTQLYADAHKCHVHMHSIEGYPVKEAVYQKLSYIDNSYDTRLLNLHQQPWGEDLSISNHFKLKKENTLFEDFTTDRKYDIIYFDAFAPSAQPHLWTSDILTTAVQSLNDQGILITFCAQGAFKRVLKSLNMTVERVPGPPGKREMTRGTLNRTVQS